MSGCVPSLTGGSRRERKWSEMSEKSVKPRVIVADDERVIADTLVVILNQNGFEATAVYNGSQILERAKTVHPDMLVSDVIMPDLNGIEAAIRIRETLPSCKILLFSGQAATADLLNQAQIQGHEFEIVAKPIHPKDLLPGYAARVPALP